VDHIFVCPLAKFVWCVVREAFGKQYLPGCRDDVVDIFLTAGGNRHNHISCFLAAPIFWSLWLTRFSIKYCLIYMAFSLMSQWKPLAGVKKLSED
jgi:hypothetical protein